MSKIPSETLFFVFTFVLKRLSFLQYAIVVVNYYINCEKMMRDVWCEHNAKLRIQSQ